MEKLERWEVCEEMRACFRLLMKCVHLLLQDTRRPDSTWVRFSAFWFLGVSVDAVGFGYNCTHTDSCQLILGNIQLKHSGSAPSDALLPQLPHSQ